MKDIYCNVNKRVSERYKERYKKREEIKDKIPQTKNREPVAAVGFLLLFICFLGDGWLAGSLLLSYHIYLSY